MTNFIIREIGLYLGWMAYLLQESDKNLTKLNQFFVSSFYYV